MIDSGNKVTIQLIGLVAGYASEFDGQYVVQYNPGYVPITGKYDGGLLLTTPDRDKARQFDSAAEAMAYWKQAHGLRSDGRKNAPLTAWSVEIA